MSLLSQAMQTFCFIDKTHVKDGYGGYTTQYVQGAEFKAAIDIPNDSTSKIANALTERRNCTITTSRTVSLEFMDIVVRKSDNQAFRILSTSNDRKTPLTAGIDMQQSAAEFWEIPSNE